MQIFHNALQFSHRMRSIKAKFAVVIIGTAIVSCASVGALSYQIGKDGLIEASKIRLEAIAANQSKALRAYDERVQQTLTEIAQSQSLGEMTEQAGKAIAMSDAKIREAFQDTSKTPEQRAAFDGSTVKMLYAVKHSSVHGPLFSAWKNADLSDIFVIDNNGQLVYTVTKGPEFMTSVQDPKNASLKSLFDASTAGPADQIYRTGFIPFKSEESDISAFLAKPLANVVWGSVVKRGTVVIRIAPANLLALISPEGLGRSVDEAFLIAADGTLRAGTLAGENGVAPELLSAAKEQMSGSVFAGGSQGSYFYSYVPVNLFGQSHLLVIGQEKSKVLASADELAKWAGLTTLAVLFGMGIVGYVFSSRLTKPLKDITGLMNRLNNGDQTIEIRSVSRSDEIGIMARALESFRQSAADKVRMEEEAIQRNGQLEHERQLRETDRARSAAELEVAVSELATGLKNLAEGRLDHRIEHPFAPSLDQLRQDFNGSMTRLQATMRQIRDNVEMIQGNGNQMAEAAEDLSKRTEQQAASLEETAAAVDEITVTVRSSAERAKDADQIVRQAKRSADDSAIVVDNAIDAMGRIEEASRQIEQITGVIDEIAFQTNLLALNAGVEAARAGDAGKGFAVVAQEVRELAQRSAKAAKEIKVLINKSTAEVNTGSHLVQETGAVLAKISTQIVTISHHVETIARGSHDQSCALQGVNSTVNQMDQMTQHNAAMVEETTAASRELASQADSLLALVQQFRIEGNARELSVYRAA
ncbi:HAMP domain-containing protein [Agrobacterium tumefaciens]|uniref:Riorf71 protein n=3 Tax=Rhizobium/Agrobacterium group TaxID=227290 RepID=Q9KWB3_RHIRH|nr:methyl-accepting chemotaxis protein [Rhizobium rhizogenes]TRB03320.1 HAMP domain-containing protein [Agrobacterium tumefaciens]ASK42952.1 methyl-accepting chemotaxis protein [Rhizobium rhizogenes]TRB16701.1 HAMP domain-containing protein [Agrobacterium tumefaciens]BAA97782.1 riorf71 [Rhizobium rhizogenes]BAB16190.1 riorf71 [Rhizobium rhizogenes]